MGEGAEELFFGNGELPLVCRPGATLYCHVWQVSRSIFMRRIQIRRDILWHSTPNTDFEHKTRKWFFGFCLSELIFFR